MFSDPQTITINSIANTLPRTSSGSNAGVFTKDDVTVKLSITHQLGKRNRRVVRLDHSKIAADPLLAGINVKATMAAYVVFDTPETGYSLAEQKQVVDGLTAYLTASAGANITKILGGES
jgi:hypothetical protein